MVNISSAAVAALFFATFPVALVAQDQDAQQLVKAELHEVTSERKRELQTLDSYTHLDRNKAVNASLNMANGNNEVEIEFLRAELPGMFNTSDLENNRINARFYPARQVGGSWECAKTGPYTENGMTGDAKLITSASYPSTFDDLTVSPDNEIYYDADQKKFMNATVQDKMGIGGVTSQEALIPDGSTTVQQHERIKLTINFAKDEFGPNNPIWDGNVDGTDGDVSFCVNLNIEDRFTMNETAGEYMWHSYLWRDFIVIMGFDLTRNIFSIGDENGQEITVTVAEVEQTQDYTYVSPNATIYQCRDDPTSSTNVYLRSDDDGEDIAQNGQIQLCISADSDEVDIGSVALRVYEDFDGAIDLNGGFPADDVRLQRVFDAGWPNTPLVPVIDDNSPAGVAEYPQIVRVYNRARANRNIDYTDATNYQTGTEPTVPTDVQKIDIQTLTSQANKNLTIVGNVKWEFRRNRRLNNRLGAPDSAEGRALQAAADDGAGASEFTFVVPVTGLEHDADKTDPVDGAAQDDSNGETDNLQSYSAALSVAEVGFLKVLGAAAVAAAALLF